MVEKDQPYKNLCLVISYGIVNEQEIWSCPKTVVIWKSVKIGRIVQLLPAQWSFGFAFKEFLKKFMDMDL